MTLIGNIFSAIVFLLVGPAPFLHVKTNVGIMQIISGLHGVVFSIIIISTLRRSLVNTLKLGFANNLDNLYVVSFSFSSVVSFSNFIGPTVAGFFVDSYGFEWTTLIPFVASLILIIVNILTLFYDIGNFKPGCASACVCMFIPQGFMAVSEKSSETTGLIQRSKDKRQSFE